jgi:hypothetical protein
MPRYLVERTFAGRLDLPADAEGARVCAAMVEINAVQGVTWVHSYVTPDRTRMVCVCDAPSPEAVRCAALANGQPVDRISEVRVLDPYFFH